MKKSSLFLAIIGMMLMVAGCNPPDNVISKKYLLIPTAEEGAVANVSVIIDSLNILGESQMIIVPKEEAEYYIPIDVQAYKKKEFRVEVVKFDKTTVDLPVLQANEYEFEYNEPYRPVYHFSPNLGWTNDPNGMYYLDGEYHLAYQANPYGTRHFNMHWGNAVSKDLMHWKDLPFIIAPDKLGAIFSGSAVVDADNCSGFGKNAVVAMYTSAGRGIQQQSIAYSTDKGRTYTKYEGNPVIKGEGRQPNFRDPKMIRIGDKWVVAIAAGDVIAFYSSSDLKNWEWLSDFGKGKGSHAAVWECPELMKFNYNGTEKWVLLVSINPGGPNGGSATQYFIGQWTGTEFIEDNLPYPLWVEEGTDNYAGVTFSNGGDRNIFVGWMSNWYYSQSVPTKYFRNAMTLPRELSLKDNGRHLFLASAPVKEAYDARGAKKSLNIQMTNGSAEVKSLLDNNSGAYEIEFTINAGEGDKLQLKLGNEEGESMDFTFDFNAST
ncbi:MAG: glycoside hydrolase family 32 protein, partial [Bacteroidales bacterium]|nr:glycoside hydrolase family 32 protein [Bacteroidales bacterium]